MGSTNLHILVSSCNQDAHLKFPPTKNMCTRSEGIVYVGNYIQFRDKIKPRNQRIKQNEKQNKNAFPESPQRLFT